MRLFTLFAYCIIKDNGIYGVISSQIQTSRPTYAAVTRKYRAPVQKFPLEPRKQMCGERLLTDLLLIFTRGRPGHVMLLPRERAAVFDNFLETADGTLDDVGTEEEIRRPNSSRRFTPSPTREADPQYVSLQIPSSPYRRSSQSPGRVERGKLRRATFQGGEAACTEILRRPPR
ncbi:hypothetical protein TNCV_3134961 [Trichonephila clavipes]|nr:hypothetical protein TNCV_3134961 [Trichonephila clavipes]